MVEKNYLVEELSKEEKSYLKKIVINTRKKYIRNNYDIINNRNIDFNCIEDAESESVSDLVINKAEREIKSAMEFEKAISNIKLYNVIKALSSKEKMVLFYLYKENNSINQIANKMQIDRTTVWRINNVILKKIIKSLLGGEKNV